VAIYALTRPESVNVPSVLGEDVDRAIVQLEDAGFEVEVLPVANPAPRDTVLEQDPRAGTEADSGSTVSLTVSTGPGQGEVPDVVGLSEREATEELRDSDFRVRSEQEPSSAVDAGTVISTDPRAGEEARLGSVVKIVVSRGPELVTVPDVLGASESSARAQLRTAGFLVNSESRDSSAESGTVIEQDPGGGSEIEEGSEVTIVVSRGPGDVTLPNVVGQREASAIARLSGLGLDVRAIERDTEARSEDGRVLEQFPSSGSEVAPGSEVVIEIGVLVESEEASTDDNALGPPP
jgi:beta-lactam-binding protein with PASTA domain